MAGGKQQFRHIVEEQRPEKIQRRSTPTTQKVWQQIQIAKYPQITYSTFGSTNCGVSDLVRCDFWRGWGGILNHQNSAFSHRVKTLKNHIFLLNQGIVFVFGQRVLIHKSYNLWCILCLFCVAMETVYKETLSMGSNVNNNGCFDFRDKYTLPMYLECAYNWYLLILENCLYKIFYKFADQTIPLSCNESWKLS